MAYSPLIAPRQFGATSCRKFSITWLFLLGCCGESEQSYKPVPQSIVDAVRGARETCFEKADASKIVPEIDRMLLKHHDAIATATTASTNFSLVFDDGAISITDTTLNVITANFDYQVDPWNGLKAALKGEFQYVTTYQVGEPWIDCEGGGVIYKNHPQSGGLYGPGERGRRIEANLPGVQFLLSLSFAAEVWDGKYCKNGACKPIYAKQLPSELTTMYERPRSAFISMAMKKVLGL